MAYSQGLLKFFMSLFDGLLGRNSASCWTCIESATGRPGCTWNGGARPPHGGAMGPQSRKFFFGISETTGSMATRLGAQEGPEMQTLNMSFPPRGGIRTPTGGRRKFPTGPLLSGILSLGGAEHFIFIVRYHARHPGAPTGGGAGLR
jgi:hypothetical protein